MEYGKRLIYCKTTGKILNNRLNEMSGDLQEGLRPQEIDFIDLPFDYNENNFKEAIEYHIDISKDKATTALKDLIVITKYVERVQTQEDKIKELENQLLLSQQGLL